LPFDSLGPQHLAEFSKWVAISGALIVEPARAKALSEKIAAIQ